MNYGPMLNAYPDSMGGTLSDIVKWMQRPENLNTFDSFYILPSIYHSDLDRGFCVVDYDLNEQLADRGDLDNLKKLGIELKLDFVLNHASVQSPQFCDLIKNGENSEYKDFFINWNTFWEGYGKMTSKGYIQPDEVYLKDMFFRKEGLPILMVKFPDGKELPYWNTFYQKVWEEDGVRHYLGQMDLNIQSEKVWKFYGDTLKKLADYGAKIIRLDAFAYATKKPGKKNFMNEPDIWEMLSRIGEIAKQNDLTLLPEIHASYEEKTYEKIAAQGYMTYDFFLPGLIIDAIENKTGIYLEAWANELLEKKIRVVNMLGCHDGIPLLDLKGMLPEKRIQKLINTVVERGGHIKDLHGAKNTYYQVNATYFSALGEDEKKLLLARAIQMFMPGKPQIWYLDLFAGKNDYEAVRLAGEGGHKEINRTNLTLSMMEEKLEQPVVKEQLKLIRFRNTNPAFSEDAEISVSSEGKQFKIRWKYDEAVAELSVDFDKGTFLYK